MSLKSKLAIGLCIAAVALFYASTFREGHGSGGDNCQYLLHARNLVLGRDYHDTGVIVNPQSLVFPASYPPVFPFLLMPIYALFGLSLAAVKFEVLIFFLLMLCSGTRLLGPSLGGLGTALWVLCVGFNPVFWEFKDYGLSEIPFLFFITLFFWLARQPSLRYRPFLLGLIAYLAYGTRSVGFLLLPALLAYDFLKRRKINRDTLATFLVFIPLVAIQWIYFHNESAHWQHKLDFFKPIIVIYNVFCYYPKHFLLLWHNAVWHIPAVVLSVGMFAMAVYGFYKRWRSGTYELFDLFVPGYLLFFIFIFFGDTNPPCRYLIPVFPYLMFYSIAGFQECSRKFPRFKKQAAWVLVTVVSLSYAFHYSRLDLGSIRNGITGVPEQEVYDFIRKHTNPDEVVAYYDPRIITFFTGRPTAQYTTAPSTKQKVDYYRKIGVKYWISFYKYRQFRHPLLKPVFHNSKYVIFELAKLP